METSTENLPNQLAFYGGKRLQFISRAVDLRFRGSS